MAKLRKEQRRINSSEITYYQNYLEQNTSKLLLNACRSARWTSIETRYQDPTCDKSAYPSRKDEGNIEYFDDSFIQIREARLYVGDCTELSGCPNYRSKSKYVSYSAVTVSGRLWATRIDCWSVYLSRNANTISWWEDTLCWSVCKLSSFMPLLSFLFEQSVY